MIKDRVRSDLQEAMKQKETIRVSTLRMMLAEMINKEKEKGQSIDDDTALRLVFSMIKKREEAITFYDAAGRREAAAREREEIAILKDYLPVQLSEDELRAEVQKTIAELGVNDLKGLGKVMGVLSKRLSGKATGSDMSRVVREELEKRS